MCLDVIKRWGEGTSKGLHQHDINSLGGGDLKRASQTRYEQPNRCIAEKIISDGTKLERYFKEPEKKKWYYNE